MVPSFGLSFAFSGRMMPPLLTSAALERWTMTWDPTGLMLALAMVLIPRWCWRVSRRKKWVDGRENQWEARRSRAGLPLLSRLDGEVGVLDVVARVGPAARLGLRPA